VTELQRVKAQIADQEAALSDLPSGVVQQIKRAASAAEGVAMSIIPDEDLAALALTIAITDLLLRSLEGE
jgi:hypothetical protein